MLMQGDYEFIFLYRAEFIQILFLKVFCFFVMVIGKFHHTNNDTFLVLEINKQHPDLRKFKHIVILILIITMSTSLRLTILLSAAL